jgi:predicted Zn-ribbon and HTH transcriptional regulator
MAANEKDRLGDKLRDVERGREDQYFAQRDRELVERLRRAKAGEAEATLKEAALMRCPKCGTRLEQHSLHGVSVDECPSCHGMWLDHPQLTELGRREDEGWIARWLRQEFRKPD